VIGPNLAQNGLTNGNGTEAGEAASQTSKNNFINGCVGKTITNGLQIPTGSCNSVPMGDIPSSKNVPSAKFTFPRMLPTTYLLYDT
jgi:transcription initiation factor TFIID subunit 15